MSGDDGREVGRLKIILGFAAGVGKTYKMLEEGQALKSAGRDIVVGYFEPHGRADTIAKGAGLEFVPRKTVIYRDREFQEMDTEAILARRPEICLVDEFPHTNVPGSTRTKRWEDVLLLLDAGIHVITTMNIQHLESLNDQVREITGVVVRETIPDWVVKRADEVVMVDLTPHALLNRLERGVVYSREIAQKAKENFFKEATLAALREMALRQTAHEVEVRQEDAAATGGQASGQTSHERILIHVTEAPTTAAVIRRGRRVADYLKADCFAVCVMPTVDGQAMSATTRELLEQHLNFARRLHIDTRVLEAGDPAQALVDFAHRHAVTQIFVAKPPKSAWPLSSQRSLVMRIVRLAREFQVTVVAERGTGGLL